MSWRKATIFVSHSTSDANVAVELRRWLVEATGGVVDVFVSSAREALPLGAMWPQEIPAVLERADLVLVLVSPSSATSSWVSYETGYAVGAKKPVIPLVYPSFNASRLDLPVQMHQSLVLNSNVALGTLIAAVNNILGTSFAPGLPQETPAQLVTLAVDAYADHWPLDAVALPSREAMYEEIVRLVQSASPEAHIQATAAIRQDRDYSDDPAYMRYISAVAQKCGDARRDEHAGQHTLFIYFPLADNNLPPANKQRSIRLRQQAFRDANASDRFEVRRLRHRWLLNVIVIGDDHAVIAFPGRVKDPKVRHAVRISGPEIVAKINHWFNLIVRPTSDSIDPETLSVIRNADTDDA